MQSGNSAIEPTRGGCRHSLAEAYSALTTGPLKPRIHPLEALRIIEENFLTRFRVVTLEPEDYLQVMRDAAAAARPGGRIYDALLLRCAAKANCDRVYTFNVRDFRAIAPPELAQRICAPSRATGSQGKPSSWWIRNGLRRLSSFRETRRNRLRAVVPPSNRPRRELTASHSPGPWVQLRDHPPPAHLIENRSHRPSCSSPECSSTSRVPPRPCHPRRRRQWFRRVPSQARPRIRQPSRRIRLLHFALASADIGSRHGDDMEAELPPNHRLEVIRYQPFRQCPRSGQGEPYLGRRRNYASVRLS